MPSPAVLTAISNTSGIIYNFPGVNAVQGDEAGRVQGQRLVISTHSEDPLKGFIEGSIGLIVQEKSLLTLKRCRELEPETLVKGPENQSGPQVMCLIICL